MKIGYMRVSTNDQNLDLQRIALERSGCELIFEEKMSGRNTERPQLKKLLRKLKPGDELLVWKIDRIGRNVLHVLTIYQDLHDRGINFVSITDSVDMRTASGRYNFRNIISFAQYEAELISERTRAGLAAAREKGRIGGRRPKLTQEQWAQAGRLIAGGTPRQQVALIYDVAMSTLYKKFPAGQ